MREHPFGPCGHPAALRLPNVDLCADTNYDRRNSQSTLGRISTPYGIARVGVERYDIIEEHTSSSVTGPDPLPSDPALWGPITMAGKGAPPPAEEIEVLLSTSWYPCTAAGNVERAVTNLAGSQICSATRRRETDSYWSIISPDI